MPDTLSVVVLQPTFSKRTKRKKGKNSCHGQAGLRAGERTRGTPVTLLAGNVHW